MTESLSEIAFYGTKNLRPLYYYNIQKEVKESEWKIVVEPEKASPEVFTFTVFLDSIYETIKGSKLLGSSILRLPPLSSRCK